MTVEYFGIPVDVNGNPRSFAGGFQPSDALLEVAERWSIPLTDPNFAVVADREDPLRELRANFSFPQHEGSDVIYFVGNSLGLQPKQCHSYIKSELDVWATRGVNGHFEGSKPWLNYDDNLVESMAKVVGAIPSEVAVMNSLTVNLHLLLVRFYNPTSSDNLKRRKILVEARLFPSDFYALESQVRLRGLDPSECIVQLSPRAGEDILRTEDIIGKIHEIGDELALVMFSGTQFYTGQLFDIKTITSEAHKVGAFAVWDLAHSAGSVDLKLHDWEVDGACWCTYKYLNSGPGGIGGFFIHEKHFNDKDADRLLGWWGHKVSTRFQMDNQFDPSEGAGEFRLSNVPILTSAALLSSLHIFDLTSMSLLRGKSLMLTGYLEFLLKQMIPGLSQESQFRIITGPDRGPQLSLLFNSDSKAKQVCGRLEELGVRVDYRKPGLVRAAPAPLYCSFTDVWKFTELLARAITELDN